MGGWRCIRFVHRLRNIVPSLMNCLGISASCWMDSDIFFSSSIGGLGWCGGVDKIRRWFCELSSRGAGCVVLR